MNDYNIKYDILKKRWIPVLSSFLANETSGYTLDRLYEYRKNRFSRRLNKSMVEMQLSNVRQIVFEVTNACNLQCKYCIYGEFYDILDERIDQYMPKNVGIKILEYFMEYWERSYNDSFKRHVTISFYGGEPLLNMPFIKEIIAFLEQSNYQKVEFHYSMTTNALLLKENISFLVAHQFRTLVSLDGNETNDGYRVRKDGSSSFPKVYENLKYVQQHYPDYFKEHIGFNSVLHNRNSFEEIFRFIYGEFGVMPMVSELNNIGIKPDKQELFWKTYRNYDESLKDADNNEQIISTMDMSSPDAREASKFIQLFSGNVFSSYNDLFIDNKDKQYCPTGTCFPFSKKVFVTVNGKILPCERIGQHFSLGEVDEKGTVSLDFEWIANKYNSYYDKLSQQCYHCYRSEFCNQCLYNIDEIDETPVCKGFLNKERFERYVAIQVRYLGEHPEFYNRVMQEMKFEI